MPKSKRAKVVHLSKVGKKGKELSNRLFEGVQECADKYQYCFVFSVENMRNNYLKDVRSQFADSKIYFGKTKVMAKALGLTEEEEHLPGLAQLSKHLNGNVGLFFTSQEPDSIISYFQDYSETDYARAGIQATRDFVVPEGVVYSRGGEVAIEDDSPVPHSIEPTLRKWGMPTRLVKGKIMLDSPHTVCREGQTLNSHQSALLKMFGVATADFSVNLIAYYNSATEEVVEIAEA